MLPYASVSDPADLPTTYYVPARTAMSPPNLWLHYIGNPSEMDADLQALRWLGIGVAVGLATTALVMVAAPVVIAAATSSLAAYGLSAAAAALTVNVVISVGVGYGIYTMGNQIIQDYQNSNWNGLALNIGMLTGGLLAGGGNPIKAPPKQLATTSVKYQKTPPLGPAPEPTLTPPPVPPNCFVAGTQVVMAEEFAERDAAADAAFTAGSDSQHDWVVAAACIAVGAVGFAFVQGAQKRRRGARRENTVDDAFADASCEWLNSEFDPPDPEPAQTALRRDEEGARQFARRAA
jgi:hypothetical protein